MIYVLGIDPGATGALALFNITDGIVEAIYDMPHNIRMLTTGKKTKSVNTKKLLEIFNDIQAFIEGYEFHVHIERVHAFSRQSAPASFNFGFAAGIIEGLVEAFGWDYVYIPPQTWKRQFNLQASEKDESRQLVIKLFPELASRLKYKYQVDRADAILLACYKP